MAKRTKDSSDFINKCKQAVFKLNKDEVLACFPTAVLPTAVARDKHDAYTWACACIDDASGEKDPDFQVEAVFIDSLRGLVNKYIDNEEFDDQARLSLILVELVEDLQSLAGAAQVSLFQDNLDSALYYNRKCFDLFKKRKQLKKDDWMFINNYMYCLNLLNRHEEMRAILEEELFEKGWQEAKLALGKKLCLEADAKLKKSWLPLIQYLLNCYVWLGIAYMHLYQPQRAKDFFDVVSEYTYLNFNNELLYNALADYYIRQSDYVQAKEYALKVLKIENNNAEAYELYALASTFQGNVKQDLKFLIQLYLKNRNEYAVKHNLLRCLIEVGEVALPASYADEYAYIAELLDNGTGELILEYYSMQREQQ